MGLLIIPVTIERNLLSAAGRGRGLSPFFQIDRNRVYT
jgi:hypothetical protein